MTRSNFHLCLIKCKASESPAITSEQHPGISSKQHLQIHFYRQPAFYVITGHFQSPFYRPFTGNNQELHLNAKQEV